MGRDGGIAPGARLTAGRLALGDGRGAAAGQRRRDGGRWARRFNDDPAAADLHPQRRGALAGGRGMMRQLTDGATSLDVAGAKVVQRLAHPGADEDRQRQDGGGANETFLDQVQSPDLPAMTWGWRKARERAPRADDGERLGQVSRPEEPGPRVEWKRPRRWKLAEQRRGRNSGWAPGRRPVSGNGRSATARRERKSGTPLQRLEDDAGHPSAPERSQVPRSRRGDGRRAGLGRP